MNQNEKLLNNFTEEATNLVNKTYKDCIRQVQKLDDGDNPVPAGTAFSFSINNRYFLITAYHVIERKGNYRRDGDGQLFLFDCNGLQKQINYRTNAHILSSENNEHGECDFVAIELLGDDILFFKRYLTEEDLLIGDLSIKNYLISIGFPESKNKFNRKNDQMRNRPYAYCGKYIQIEKDKFFGIPFDNKKDPVVTQPPNPSGMSGSPVFSVVVTNCATKYEPKLCGMLITHIPQDEILKAIDMRNIFNKLKFMQSSADP